MQIGEPEVRNNGDVNISLRVQGSQHYRVFEWVMTLYHDSNQCSVQANKVYMAGNYSFKGRILLCLKNKLKRLILCRSIPDYRDDIAKMKIRDQE